MEPRFTIPITIHPSDIDALGHVNNVVYVRWVQDVAAAHWDTVAPDSLRLRFRWVVLRHEVDYRSAAFLSDKLVGETWVGDHYGARFERFVRVFSTATGKEMAEAKTIWCMLDAATMKPVRITPEVLAVL